MGRPGCGKTSFLYSLIRESEDKDKSSDILSGVVFYMFHANRVTTENAEEAENIVVEYILAAWKKLYSAANKADVYHRVEEQKVSNKQKLNTLTEYYKDRRSEFTKVLIFLIDDADLVQDQEVQNVVRAVLRNLNVTYVKKWLVIRECTYQGYTGKTRDLIDGFFPDRREFPKISLNEIICHRIRNGTGTRKAKNPFSEELCHVILEGVFDGNLRESLAILQNMLAYISPGEFAITTDERVIQQYVNKCSINALIGLGHLPNLYEDRYRCGHLPLVMDVLLCNRHTKTREHLYGAVNLATACRVDEAHLVEEGKRVKVRENDFDSCINTLTDLGLAERQGKYVAQTPKGALLSEYVQRSHYRELCEGLVGRRFGADATFWRLVSCHIDHGRIVLGLITWDIPG